MQATVIEIGAYGTVWVEVNGCGGILRRETIREHADLEIGDVIRVRFVPSKSGMFTFTRIKGA